MLVAAAQGQLIDEDGPSANRSSPASPTARGIWSCPQRLAVTAPG